MNERAWALVDAAAARARELRVDVQTLPGGARVLDAGVHAVGGLAAGRLLAEICMGGLGYIDFVPLTVGDEPLGGQQRLLVLDVDDGVADHGAHGHRTGDVRPASRWSGQGW